MRTALAVALAPLIIPVSVAFAVAVLPGPPPATEVWSSRFFLGFYWGLWLLVLGYFLTMIIALLFHRSHSRQGRRAWYRYAVMGAAVGTALPAVWSASVILLDGLAHGMPLSEAGKWVVTGAFTGALVAVLFWLISGAYLTPAHGQVSSSSHETSH